MSVTYKDYEMQASSNFLPEKQKWDATVAIIKIRDKDGNAHHQNFNSLHLFDSEQVAISNAFVLGKEIIDGKRPEMTLSF